MQFDQLNLLSIGNTIQIAGVIFVGEGQTLLCFFPDEHPAQPFEVLQMDLDQWNAFLRQTDVMETEVLTRASDGTLAKAIVRKSQRQIEAGVSWRVWKRDGYRCRYCGNDDVPLTVDHLVLWEEGGHSIEQNLLSSCKKCNKTRGNMQYAEWLQHPRYVSLSTKLAPDVRASNEALLSTLASIPRRVHSRSR